MANVGFDEIAACATADEAAFDADISLPQLISWVDPRDGSISFVRMPQRASGWRKALYLLLAGVFLVLGLIGVVLPGLPTTPFVLLGSYFLLRSSQRLHQRLMASKLFGGILRDWHVHRGIRPHVRARAIAVVAIVVVASLVIARPPLPVVLGILRTSGVRIVRHLAVAERDGERVVTIAILRSILPPGATAGLSSSAL